MNEHERRESTSEAAREQVVTRPPGAGAEESKQDPYCDEGGES